MTASGPTCPPSAKLPALKLPAVMGHRGAAAVAPENTLASIRAAAAAGLGWIEFDVMLTQDDVPILFHDETLWRTTGQTGDVAATSFGEFRCLEAGTWFHTRFAGEAVPSLQEAVSLMDELGLCANVEIKPTAGRERVTAEVALAVLRECWPDSLAPPLISSFQPDCLAVACEQAPDWPRSLLLAQMVEDWPALMTRYACVGLHCRGQLLRPGQIDPVKEAGYATACYTVNDRALAKRLYDWGIDCLITDAPDRILPVARDKGFG